MQDAPTLERIRRKFLSLTPLLDERSRRQWAATEARDLGRGGVSLVARATGLSRTTIAAGLKELADPASAASGTRIRRPGAGRPPQVEAQPGLAAALDALVDPATRGDPISALRWTCKSTERLAAELQRQGFQVSPRTVASILQEMGYSLQANRKTREGTAHPDRNAQFEYINAQVRRMQKRGQPVVSVDTKKKELIGDFANSGREWQPKGKPEPVRVHDFEDPELKKVIPYGVYDLTNNQAWVSVGIDHDTARFAARTIRRWWDRMGLSRFPRAKELLITADGGGSNSSRSRLWKVALQELADATGLTLRVCHFPPGTSKWNKIEHRLFSYITKNWRGRPLASRQAVVELIASTTTKAGLLVEAALDTQHYPTRVKVSDAEMARVNLTPAEFHGDWNYTIAPRISAN